MYTLNGTEVHCVCYAIGAYESNAWKSKNPHSGVYVTETAKTLDNMNCGYPACQQGGWLLLKYVNLEYHPCDSRIRIEPKDVCQTLNQRMGTGGGNVPLILLCKDDENINGETVFPLGRR